MWTKPGAASAQNAKTSSPSVSPTAVVPAATDNRGGKTKSYNWVNSYFRNRASSTGGGTATAFPPQNTGSSGATAAEEVAQLEASNSSSEVPEMRSEMAPRQSSFMRKVQGKRKQKL